MVSMPYCHVFTYLHYKAWWGWAGSKTGMGMGEEEFASPQNIFEFENAISRNILEILNLGN